MKNLIIISVVALFYLSIEVAHSQYLSLSYPKHLSVLQRDGANKATVTIAG